MFQLARGRGRPLPSSPLLRRRAAKEKEGNQREKEKDVADTGPGRKTRDPPVSGSLLFLQRVKTAIEKAAGGTLKNSSLRFQKIFPKPPCINQS